MPTLKEKFKQNFQQNALNLRLKYDHTQQHLAELLKINPKTVAAIEEGRTIGIENLYKYSLFFNVSINDLITTKIK